METVKAFIFLGFKITVDGDFSHKIKRCLLLGRKTMTNLDRILKSRDINCWQNSVLSKLWFPVVMYVCESWTIKKAERRRIDAFELWCWRSTTLESPLDCKDIQPVLAGYSLEYSLEGLMLKLKPQYFGHLMQRADSFEKTPMPGKIEGGRRRGQQRMRWMVGWHHWLYGHEFE